MSTSPPRSDEPGMTLAEVQALRAEIGVLDATQARGWKPPAGSTGRLIRGATGSPWVNRLSTLVLLLLVVFSLGMVFGLQQLVRQIVSSMRGAPPVVCAVTPGSAAPRLDLLQQLPAVAAGRLQLSPKLGTHQIDSLQQLRLQTVQYQGAEVRIWRSQASPDSLVAVDVLHPAWSVCELAMAARWARSGDTLQLGRSGEVQVGGRALAAPVQGWHYRLEALQPVGSRLRLERGDLP